MVGSVGYHQDEHSNKELAEIQLVTKILIRRNEQIKACGFGSGEQIAIEKFGPAALPRSFDVVRCKPAFEGQRHALVEQNPHQVATRLRSAC
jgi:hypothetical protein